MNMNTADFLIEIQCEELPSKALDDLGRCLGDSIWQQLCSQPFESKGSYACFATPRRLAVLLTGLSTKQQDQLFQKRGPALNQAYDTDGKPSKACLGFLKSCNAEITDLKTLKTDQGEWVYCEQHMPGKSTRELIPEIVINAIKALPVPKWMRWGSHTEQFARPVHHIVLMCDDNVIDATILGLRTGNVTQGHRFISSLTRKQHLDPHFDQPIIIKHAKDYEQTLLDNFVIADFDARKAEITKQIETILKNEQLKSFDLPGLLDEVTALVEWPTAFIAEFDKRFLQIPAEALIAAITGHQKSFPLTDITGKLTNKFIFISNITPQDPSIMIQGNEKVMRARLSDIDFFYQTDLKTPLKNLVEKLKTVALQDNLGTLHDKALRLEKLCDTLSNEYPHAKRAGLLAKTDLLTNMVCEFTELQGAMGYYYAKHDGENIEVATALKEHYLPRFAEDQIARTPSGITLSIADKLDNLVGSFGINQIPTGSKDPFGLRRAAIGIIRTIIENNLEKNLKTLIQFAISIYQTNLVNKNIETDLLQFFNDRFRVWLKDQDFELDVIDAVLSLNTSDFNDCFRRINAVTEFKKLPEAESLAAANKRVANILQKNTAPLDLNVNEQLFEKPAETALYNAILEQEKNSQTAPSYTATLTQLAALKPAIDAFFDDVMVNAEDEKIRLNRLNVLTRLRALFLKVADIAYLQKI